MGVTLEYANRHSVAVSSSPSTGTMTGYVPVKDDVIGLVPSSTSSASITIPSGWVNILGGTTDVETNVHQLCAVYHLVTQAEEDDGTNVYTATGLFDTSETGAVLVFALRGVDPANVIDAVATISDNGNVTPHVLPALAGVDLVDNSFVVGVVTSDSSVQYTEPLGWTLRAQAAGGQQGSAILTRNTLTTAGGDVSATDITPSSGDQYIGLTVAFTELTTAQDVAPSSITSAETFGTARIDLHVTPSGVASSEAFGTARIDMTLTVSGIASAEAFGTPSVTPVVRPTGIASAEVFGTPRIDQHVTASGIGSAEAFGTTIFATGAVNIAPAGIASAEAFGVAQVALALTVSGIASAEAFGTPRIDLSVMPTGIASGEAFGTPVVAHGTLIIAPQTISSGEAFGTPRIDMRIVVTGVASAEAFGHPTVSLIGPPQTISPASITSAEVFGTTTVTLAPDAPTPSGRILLIRADGNELAIDDGGRIHDQLAEILLTIPAETRTGSILEEVRQG